MYQYSRFIIDDTRCPRVLTNAVGGVMFGAEPIEMDVADSMRMGAPDVQFYYICLKTNMLPHSSEMLPKYF